LERAKARTRSQIAQAEAEKQAKAAAVDLAGQRQRDCASELQKCVLLAPADGIVLYPAPSAGRFSGVPAIAPGESVREGQPILRVADLKKYQIATRVHEAMISTVRVGQPVRVRVDAYPDKQL